MGGVFNQDNRVWQAVSRFGDLMLLNLLFLLGCLPIVTIGASLTALHYVTLKMRGEESGYLTRNFVKSYKQNFKQATLIWLAMLLAGAVIVLDLLVLQNAEGAANHAMLILNRVLFLPYGMLFLYVFPVLARFENTTGRTLQNAFLMSVLHFPLTLVMALITAVPVVLGLLNAYTMYWAFAFWALVGFALLAYGNGYFLHRIFKKYMKETEHETV